MSYVRPRASFPSHTQLGMHWHDVVLLRATAPRLLLASAEEELQGQAPMHADAECTRPPTCPLCPPGAGYPGHNTYMETCMSARRRSAWLARSARSKCFLGANCPLRTTRLFNVFGAFTLPLHITVKGKNLRHVHHRWRIFYCSPAVSMCQKADLRVTMRTSPHVECEKQAICRPTLRQSDISIKVFFH